MLEFEINLNQPQINLITSSSYKMSDFNLCHINELKINGAS